MKIADMHIHQGKDHAAQRKVFGSGGFARFAGSAKPLGTVSTRCLVNSTQECISAYLLAITPANEERGQIKRQQSGIHKSCSGLSEPYALLHPMERSFHHQTFKNDLDCLPC